MIDAVSVVDAALPPGLDEVALRPVVRRAVADDEADVDAWSATALPRGAGPATAALLRVRGTGTSPRGRRDWSAVLKVLHEGEGSSEPSAGTTGGASR